MDWMVIVLGMGCKRREQERGESIDWNSVSQYTMACVSKCSLLLHLYLFVSSIDMSTIKALYSKWTKSFFLGLYNQTNSRYAVTITHTRSWCILHTTPLSLVSAQASFQALCQANWDCIHLNDSTVFFFIKEKCDNVNKKKQRQQRLMLVTKSPDQISVSEQYGVFYPVESDKGIEHEERSEKMPPAQKCVKSMLFLAAIRNNMNFTLEKCLCVRA